MGEGLLLGLSCLGGLVSTVLSERKVVKVFQFSAGCLIMSR
jgi:hypothetical protein